MTASSLTIRIILFLQASSHPNTCFIYIVSAAMFQQSSSLYVLCDSLSFPVFQFLVCYIKVTSMYSILLCDCHKDQQEFLKIYFSWRWTIFLIRRQLHRITVHPKNVLKHVSALMWFVVLYYVRLWYVSSISNQWSTNSRHYPFVYI